MRVFKEFPENGVCPICGMNTKKECVLIGILGTEDGNNITAQPFHLDCLELLYDKHYKIIFQKTKFVAE